jgi:hypothetical protein
LVTSVHKSLSDMLSSSTRHSRLLLTLLRCTPSRLLTNLSHISSARTSRKTPSSVAKTACLLVRYLTMDVLLVSAYASGMRLPSRCLTMDLYLLTYLFMELSPSWGAVNCATPQEPPAFHGTRRFNTVFTRALHWSLSWAISMLSTPSYPISLRSILILSTHLRLSLPSGLVPSGMPTNILYAFLFSPIRATCPSQSMRHNII